MGYLPYDVSASLHIGITHRIKHLEQLIDAYLDTRNSIRPSMDRIQDEYKEIKAAIDYFHSHSLLTADELMVSFAEVDKLLNQNLQKEGVQHG